MSWRSQADVVAGCVDRGQSVHEALVGPRRRLTFRDVEQRSKVLIVVSQARGLQLAACALGQRGRPGCGLQRKVGRLDLAHLVLGPPFIWAGAAEVQCGATRGTYGVRRPMIRLGGPNRSAWRASRSSLTTNRDRGLEDQRAGAPTVKDATCHHSLRCVVDCERCSEPIVESR